MHAALREYIASTTYVAIFMVFGIYNNTNLDFASTAAFAKKFAALIFVNKIHRDAKMFGDMESLKRDTHVGEVSKRRNDIRRHMSITTTVIAVRSARSSLPRYLKRLSFIRP